MPKSSANKKCSQFWLIDILQKRMLIKKVVQQKSTIFVFFFWPVCLDAIKELYQIDGKSVFSELFWWKLILKYWWKNHLLCDFY